MGKAVGKPSEVNLLLSVPHKPFPSAWALSPTRSVAATATFSSGFSHCGYPLLGIYLNVWVGPQEAYISEGMGSLLKIRWDSFDFICTTAGNPCRSQGLCLDEDLAMWLVHGPTLPKLLERQWALQSGLGHVVSEGSSHYHIPYFLRSSKQGMQPLILSIGTV